MGSSVSEEIKKDKQQSLTTHYVMNTILNYMLKELSIRDFHALSNPSVCNKYVLFMANNMYKHFYDIQLFPYRNEKRVLLFRKVEDLVNPSDEERQSLCLVLSYYYVRIFQIYGALALTLIDDASFMTTSGLTSFSQQYAPGHPRYVRGGGKDLFYYAFIRSYIKDGIFDDEKGYRLRYSGTNSIKCTVYFMPKSRMNTDGYYGLFTLYLNDRKYFIDCAITEIKNDEYRFKISSINYNNIDGRISIPISVNPIIVRKENNGYTMDRNSIENGFNTLFENIIRTISNFKGDTLTTSKDVTISESKIKELSIDGIIQNLTKVKPLGHCIARAMQLLRSEPLENKYGISNICKTKFFETAKDTSRSGIPEPGESLSKSPGLSALSNLFYDTIYVGTPQLVRGDKKVEGSNESSLQQYIKFMKLMSIRFGNTPQEKLENIKNIRDREVCKGMPEDIYIPYDTSVEVFKLVKQLFAIQANHAARCGKILSMLFNISYDSTGRLNISLSNNIIEKGFSEIDRINHYARDILIAYYSNCEYKYVEGMKLIVESKVTPRSNPLQANVPASKNIIRALQERSEKPQQRMQPVQRQNVSRYDIPRHNLLFPDFIQPIPGPLPSAPPAPAPTAPTAPPASNTTRAAPLPSAPTASTAPNTTRAPPTAPATATAPSAPAPNTTRAKATASKATASKTSTATAPATAPATAFTAKNVEAARARANVTKVNATTKANATTKVNTNAKVNATTKSLMNKTI